MTSAALSTITNPLLFPERRAGTATLAQRMARLSAALKVVPERPCNAASEGHRLQSGFAPEILMISRKRSISDRTN
jgi:hypothetical protein